MGNPPYVEYSKVRKNYTVKGYQTESCGNLYALCSERFLNLVDGEGHLGVIVPISSVSTRRMAPLMTLLTKQVDAHISNFAVRPGKLFDGVDMNLTIVLGHHSHTVESQTFTTRYTRWNLAFRPFLFGSLQYIETIPNEIPSAITKFGSKTDIEIMRRILQHESIVRFRSKTSKRPIYWHNGGRYFRKCLLKKLSRKYVRLNLRESTVDALLCLLSSSLYYWFWLTISDCYDVVVRDIDAMRVPESLVQDKNLIQLAEEFLSDLDSHASVRNRTRLDGSDQKEINFDVAASKPIIDEIDRVLAKHYSFTDEELDFIINYDIKYRTGGKNSNHT